MKIKAKGRSIKDQFVLSVGDEGAILCHFNDGKLANRIFADSPLSEDIRLIEKLAETYPKSPIRLLVDVIEQNYSQQVLPPVSALGVKQQISRRIKRDFQPNDLNNVYALGRSKEGRKDWNFLFISLANTDPFAKWLDFALRLKNKFDGVYLLPVEAMGIAEDLNRTSTNEKRTEWELLIFHNKVGGFRICALKNGKLIFTRLAQNLIGDSVPDIIVGNMEQEISNTVEYLKRLAFKSEAESKITIIASSDILQRVDTKRLKFGQVNLLTPHDASERLNMPEAVTDKDRFADIFCATHFAAAKKHILRFSSSYTKKIEGLYTGIKASYAGSAIIALLLLGLIGSTAYDINFNLGEEETVNMQLTQTRAKLQDIQTAKAKLPKDVDKMLSIMNLANSMKEDKYKNLRPWAKIAPLFGQKVFLTNFQYQIIDAKPVDAAAQAQAATSNNFSAELSVEFNITKAEQDGLNKAAQDFLKEMQKLFPKEYQITYTNLPQAGNENQFEQINNEIDDGTKLVIVPAKLEIRGDLK